TAVAPRTVVAVLGPSRALDSREGKAIAMLPADLLLAGPGASAAFRCLGYEVRPRWRDSLVIAAPPGAESRPFPRARGVLARRPAPVFVDSAGADDGAAVTCTAPAARTVDTLLRTVRGQPVAIRASLEDGRSATLVADDGLFSNRALRETAA